MAEEIVAIYRAEVEGYKQQVDQLVGKVDALTAAQGKAQAASTNLGKSAVSTGKQIAAAFGVTAGVAMLVNTLRSASKAAMTFEAQMSKVRAVSGATDAEMKRLEKSAKALGASTMFTATQVGELQEAYARLGFTTKEILAATAATLDLAAATGSTLAEAADVAGSTIRGFGLDASETVRVTDVMAMSFSKSALGMSSFAEAMKMVAPIARAANIDVETTTALLGKLADAGMRGSLAGTALKNLLSQLSNANSDLSKELGMSVKNSDELFEAFRRLQGANIDLTKATELTDERSKAAFLTLINGADSANKLKVELDGAAGSTKKMAEMMQDNLAGSLTKLSSAWEGFTNQILGKQGALKAVVDLLTMSIQGWELILRRAAGETAAQSAAMEDAFHMVESGVTSANSAIKKIVKPLEDAGNMTEAIAKATELYYSASDKLTGKLDAQRVASEALAAAEKDLEDFQKKSLSQGLLFRDIQSIVAARQKEIEQLKLRKIAAEGEADAMSSIVDVYDRYILKLKEAGGEGGAIAVSVRNIELLSGELKTLKEELEKAEIGSANFFAVLDKVNAKIKELKEAEAMTKLADALIPDAEEMMAVSEAYIREMARMAQADADLAAKRAAATEKEMAAFEELQDYRIYLMGNTMEAEIVAIRLAAQRKLAEYTGWSTAEIQLRAAIEEDAQMQIDAVRKAWEEKAAQDRKARFDKELQETQQYIAAVGSLYSSFAALQEAASNRELAALQNRLDQGLISEEEYDQERRQIARKQAADRKQAALFEATINGITAVINAFKDGGPALAIITGVAVAAQIAAIASEPLPQFEHGGVVKADGSMVGRRHSQGGIIIEAEGGEHITRRKYASEWADLLESVNNGNGMSYINKHFVAPAVSEAMLKGMDDIGTSAALNGLAGFSDMNLLSAIDRHRETEVAALIRIEKALTRQNTPDRKRWN